VLRIELMLTMLPPASPKCFTPRGCEEIAKHVQVELLVERVLRQVGDHLEHRDAGIVDEHVNLAVIRHYRVEQPHDIGGLGHVGLHRRGFAAAATIDATTASARSLLPM
jgi:hypothetical protein